MNHLLTLAKAVEMMDTRDHQTEGQDLLSDLIATLESAESNPGEWTPLSNLVELSRIYHCILDVRDSGYRGGEISGDGGENSGSEYTMALESAMAGIGDAAMAIFRGQVGEDAAMTAREGDGRG
jgi:hypothetical protein